LSRQRRRKQLKPGAVVLTAPSFLRRLAAVFYDAILLIAVLFFATALLLPFNKGLAFTSEQFFYPPYLFFISGLFYTWFWTHGGQTPGLRAWKMTVLTFDQKPITWKQAILRYIAAILSWLFFGFGFLWIFFDKNQRSWHDRLSKTALFLTRTPPP